MNLFWHFRFTSKETSGCGHNLFHKNSWMTMEIGYRMNVKDHLSEILSSLVSTWMRLCNLGKLLNLLSSQNE